jgi:hypothetical protein
MRAAKMLCDREGLNFLQCSNYIAAKFVFCCKKSSRFFMAAFGRELIRKTLQESLALSGCCF